jgi:polyphosphate kinase 2 (PPK2 family)
MMTTAKEQFINKFNQPTKVYKVTYEHLKTNKQFHVYVEAKDSRTAGESVISALGKEYDLIQSIGAKRTELH